MYKCESCNKLSAPRVALNKKVVSSRKVSYVNKVWDREKEEEFTKTTEGSEIVKELSVCNNCLGV